MATRLLIVGAGGHGRQVAEAVRLADELQLVGFVDDGAAAERRVLGCPVLGGTADLAALREHAHLAVVAIGDNRARERLTGQLRDLGYLLATVVHPDASVSASAQLGAGCSVMAGARIGTEARLGDSVIVNSGVTVDHHAVVEDFAHLGVGVVMAGGARARRGAWLRAGCVLGYGAEVPADALLPPGTVLGE